MLERRATSAIAWITILTGALQIVAPTALLPFLGVDPEANSTHLFSTIGMFMTLFGGAVLHAQLRREALPIVLLWAAFQKIGASLLVVWGVSRGVFFPLTLLVAAFDFASGLLFADLRRRGG